MMMEEYLNKIKSIFDCLALAESPVSQSDLILQTLSGLNAEYTPIIDILSDKDNLTWIDL